MNQHEMSEALSKSFSQLDVRLRNKLSVLLPALDLLEKKVAPDGKADAAVLRYLGEARRSAFSILRIAQNLGDQAKFAVDYDMSDPVKTDLTALFSSIAAETRAMAAYKNTLVMFESSETPFYAFIDPDMTSRLLYNLLSNAVLHGEGDVRAELKREDGCLLFTVRNTGGEAPNLYESQPLGTGLSVASAIVCQCGGTMMTTFDPSGGTVVTVSLPDRPGGDEGEPSLSAGTCSFPSRLVEFSDFPAYNPDYNLQRRGQDPCATSMP
ncbi:MAG: HAMP domain-containing histidine kinase [Oscillospiraceae bacterium]|nr:HAMP domain-containing histidine kinase [Oscillospiraceae bacterium]